MNREAMLQKLRNEARSWFVGECNLTNGWKVMKDFDTHDFIVCHAMHDPITRADWTNAQQQPKDAQRVYTDENGSLVYLKLNHDYSIQRWHHPSWLTPTDQHSISRLWDKATVLSPSIEARVLAAKVNDAVKKPNHYQMIDGVESIEIIASCMTREEWRGFCLGNELKYRLRAGKKDALQQDIDKANEYGLLFEKHKELNRHER